MNQVAGRQMGVPVTDRIDRIRYELSMLQGDTSNELLDWAQGCHGETMGHIELEGALLRVNRVAEDIDDIRTRIIAARDTAYAALAREKAA